MLIRLCNHHVLNPHLIDKLIVIEGLPKEWIFKKVEKGDQLLPPWEPDVDANVPISIRHLAKPVTYCKWFPPVRHYDKDYGGFWDTRTVFALKLDLGYGPAQEVWEKIEAYIEKTLPRGVPLPIPVLVAPDQKSIFNPHLAKKTDRGHIQLYSADIPVLDLNAYVVAPAPAPLPAPVTVTAASQHDVKLEIKQTPTLRCNDCDFSTMNPKALRMHKSRKHSAVEKVAA